MPPPDDPPRVPSFQARSSVIFSADPTIRVPPQARTFGLEAGKSACARPSPTRSPEPLSPDAQVTVTPRIVASAKAWGRSSLGSRYWSIRSRPRYKENIVTKTKAQEAIGFKGWHPSALEQRMTV